MLQYCSKLLVHVHAVIQRLCQYCVYYPSQISVDKHFFWPASQTVGASQQFKNSGHVMTFLWLCGLQNTDHMMPFWLFL